MQTLSTIQQIIAQVKYKDYQFILTKKGDGFNLQVQFVGIDTDTGKQGLQKCRKWYISPHMVPTEIVRTCFLAIRQAEEHELCENFRYKGVQIFSPHLDLDKMAEFVNTKPFECRS